MGESNSDCISSKYVGKKSYYSPEIVSRKKGFNAKSNDIWCCGVALFMMVFGTTPFGSAHCSDIRFQLIMSGDIMVILKQWKRAHYATSDILDLLSLIFQYEEERISVHEI